MNASGVLDIVVVVVGIDADVVCFLFSSSLAEVGSETGWKLRVGELTDVCEIL